MHWQRINGNESIWDIRPGDNEEVDTIMSWMASYRSYHCAWRLFLSCILTITCTSCSKSGPKLYPVKGKISYDGQPPAGASVIFAPVNTENNLKPTGRVEADGTFKLLTYPHGEGAPAGDYNVLVNWYPDNAREMDNAKNQLPEKYNDLSAPLLKATIKEETNELPPMQLDK